MKIKEVVYTSLAAIVFTVVAGVVMGLGLHMLRVIMVGYPTQLQHTWIEDLPDDKIENDYTDDHYRFPVQLTNGGLKTVKTVTDVLTGDMVYVVGKPWLENGRQCYRILREARSEPYVFTDKPGENPIDKGWVKEQRFSEMWIIETRALEELTQLPSA